MLDDGKIESYVRKNTDYYVEKWRAFHDVPSSAVSFNRAAVFGSAVWLIYRKLYVPLVGLIVVIVADVSLTIYLEENRLVSAEIIAMWDQISVFVYAGVIGAFGNYWYWRKFQRLEEQARSQSPDPAIQHEFLHSKGGTNSVGAWLVVIVVIALIFSPFLLG